MFCCPVKGCLSEKVTKELKKKMVIVIVKKFLQNKS
jgi:hypothetical protein